MLNEPVTSFNSVSALSTLRRALAGSPLADSDLVLLRPPADNAVISIPSAGIVARLGAVVGFRDRLRRELELATWLIERGIATAGPATSPPTAQLLEVDGRVVTWWEYLPTTEHGTVDDIGHILTRLHHERRPWPELLPLDPWNRVSDQLAAAEGGLPDGDLSSLRDHWDRLCQRWDESRWPAEPPVVLHGDAHQGNTLAHEGRVYLLDFEDARLGPRQWDVASIMGGWRVGWLTDDEFDRFATAYGHDDRNDDGVDVLVDISLFRRTCWYASRARREPEVVEAVCHRIATLADPSLPRHWRKG